MRCFSDFASGRRSHWALPAVCAMVALAGCESEHAAPAAGLPGSPDRNSTTVGSGLDQTQMTGAARPGPSRVTLDIQDGIERHIAEKVEADGGAYQLDHEGEALQLKLVRVHREYLSKLGPTSHFACVDLATTDGDVFDVDFFLEGAPGDMHVVEVTVHKKNGRPYYVWEQQVDKTWNRVPFEGAPPQLLGVIKGTDEFEFVYRSETPAIQERATMWIPVPRSDEAQAVELTKKIVPGKHEVVEDAEYGNQILVLALGPEDGEKPIELRYHVKRREQAVYESSEPDLARYLERDALVPTSGEFLKIATEVIDERVRLEQEGDLVRARALYDHVMEKMRYAKIGNEYGHGDAQYACDARAGNCTDYHSYFIALARAAKIPARFAIGASIPSMRDEGGISGYHCWAEFHADGKWWPIDVSEADKCAPLSTYFFGRHPANRVELSRGRDLRIDPLPSTGPINYLAYPVLEVDGEPMAAKRDFSFRRLANGAAG